MLRGWLPGARKRCVRGLNRERCVRKLGDALCHESHTHSGTQESQTPLKSRSWLLGLGLESCQGSKPIREAEAYVSSSARLLGAGKGAETLILSSSRMLAVELMLGSFLMVDDEGSAWAGVSKLGMSSTSTPDEAQRSCPCLANSEAQFWRRQWQRYRLSEQTVGSETRLGMHQSQLPSSLPSDAQCRPRSANEDHRDSPSYPANVNHVVRTAGASSSTKSSH